MYYVKCIYINKNYFLEVLWLQDLPLQYQLNFLGSISSKTCIQELDLLECPYLEMGYQDIYIFLDANQTLNKNYNTLELSGYLFRKLAW